MIAQLLLSLLWETKLKLLHNLINFLGIGNTGSCLVYHLERALQLHLHALHAPLLLSFPAPTVRWGAINLRNKSAVMVWNTYFGLTFRVNMKTQPHRPSWPVATLPVKILCYRPLNLDARLRWKERCLTHYKWSCAVLPHSPEWTVEAVESGKVPIQQVTVKVLSSSEVSKVFSGLSYTVSIVQFAALGTCYAVEPYSVFAAIAPSTGSTSDLSWTSQKWRWIL